MCAWRGMWGGRLVKFSFEAEREIRLEDLVVAPAVRSAPVQQHVPPRHEEVVTPAAAGDACGGPMGAWRGTKKRVSDGRVDPGSGWPTQAGGRCHNTES